MFFSIIIPVYNVEKYLRECLDSIIGQTEQDFEIVLINDGSIDASGEICDEYAEKYLQKVNVFHQENKGALLARRAGINNAKGEYFLFVDSDDYLDSHALEIIKDTIKKSNCDMVMYNRNNFSKSGKMIKPPPLFKDGEVFEGDGKKKLYRATLLGFLPSLAVKAVKRSLLDIGIDYTPYKSIGNNMDFLQVLPIVTNSEKAVYINKHLYYYRYNPVSVTKAFRPGKYKSIREMSNKLHEYLEIWNLKEEEKNLNKRNLTAALSSIAQTIGAKDSPWGKKEKLRYLEEVSNDDFFRKAYNGTERKTLGISHRIYGGLLYQHKYSVLLLISKMDSMLNLRDIRLNLMRILLPSPSNVESGGHHL